MPKVLNRSKAKEQQFEHAVYVGRPSKWGNPYPISPSGYTRDESIARFRKYLWERPWLVEAAQKELAGRDLMCWCAPKACHGDVLAQAANGPKWKYAQFADHNYEVSSAGDTRFSPLFAHLHDGRTIEEAYQLDVKGWRGHPGMTWRLAKGKPPVTPCKPELLFAQYVALWRMWADENEVILAQLAMLAKGRTLTDRFGHGPITQAHALAYLLDERHPLG